MDQLDSRPAIRSAGPAIASAVLALALYAITLGGTYVYDDRTIIPGDPRVTQHQWSKFWTTDYANGSLDNLYRPIVSMSYGIQWMIHGDKPWAFHLVNILLHAIAAAALAEFTRRWTSTAAGYLAGLLFAVHPIHVEAVANIVGRAELLCAAFVFATLLIFSKRPLTNSRIFAIVACLIIAVLSKEQGLVLPLILLAFGWFVRPSAPGERSAIKTLVILITWCGAGYLFFREHFLRFNWDRGFLDWAMQPMIRCVGIDRWLMPVVLLGHYFQLLVFPYKLSPDYGANVIGWVVHWNDPYLWTGFLALATWIAAVAIAYLKKTGFELFCLLSLAFSYGLIGNLLVLIGTNLSERLMYLPSAFFLMFIAALLVRLPRPFWVSITAILLALGSIRTFTYARRWNDRLNFYTQSLAEQPKSIQLYLLTGWEYIERHDPDSAEKVLARGCQMYPDHWWLWIDRSYAAMDRNRLADAEEYLRRAFDANTLPPYYFSARDRLEKLKAQREADQRK